MADSVDGPDADLIVSTFLRDTDATLRGLDKQGVGTMVLTDNNLYTGATLITGGTLQVGSNGDDGSLATSGITNNSALVYDQSGIQTDAQTAAYPISGIGTLTKTGAGKLTLSNSTHSYSGTTTVSNGQLYVNGSLSASSAVSVKDGALLGGTGTIANLTTVADGGSIEGGANGAGTLTFTNGLTFSGTGNIHVGDLANYTSAPALAAGPLSTSGMDGSIAIHVASVPGIGTYQLASYTGTPLDAAAQADFTLATPLPSRALGSLDFSTPNLIKINVTSLDSLKWAGVDGVDPAAWDNDLTQNWKLASNNNLATFIVGDTVLFDDSASSFDVSLKEDVSPAQVTFDNSINHYTLGSDFYGIVGSATLTKNGTGDLTITNINLSSGATIINGGRLVLGNGTTDGSLSSTSITNNAALVYNLANADRTVNATITGTGSVTKTGAMTLTLAAANTHSGGTILAGGTLIAGVPDVGGSPGPNSLGTGTLTLQTGTTFRGRSVYAIPSAVDIDGTGIVLSGANPPNLVLGGNLTGDATDAFSVTSRVRLAGDNSGFSGTVTVTAAGDFVYLGSADSGSANAKFNVNGQLIASATGAFTVKIGSLEGSGNLSGPYEGLANQPTFEIGGRNENSTFSGHIRNNEGDSTFLSNKVTLIKVGTGTLTLTGLHTYSGDTTVSAGTLSLGQVNVSNETSTVNIAPGAVLDLAYSGTDTVDKLFIGGVQQPAGDYTSNGLTITGGGTLHVNAGPAGYSSWAALNGASANLDEDHDGDGVSNGIEYFIGGPNGLTTGFTGPLPGVVSNSGLSVTWTHAADYIGIYGTDFEVETSETLSGAWTQETVGGNVTITGNDVKYTFPSGPVKNFARLKVTGP